MSPIKNEVTLTPERLRLSGSPSLTLQGYLRLEDALNMVGQQDHPATWGQIQGWAQMPFRWSKKKKAYVRHDLRLMGERARLRQIPVKLDLAKAERLACVRLYRDVRATIRAAFEAGDLSAYAIHHATGARTLIDAPAIWLKQARPIFYTGRTVIRESEVADRLADVVIEQATFDRWMEARGKELAKTASEAMLRRVGETIGKHEHKLDYGITRAEAFALVAGVAKGHGKEVSERQFRKHVWAPRGSKAGRRTKVQKERFTQHSSDLATQIAALFGDSSAA